MERIKNECCYRRIIIENILKVDWIENALMVVKTMDK
jgi:hypothetical protein